VVLAGTLGYALLERWSLLDSLYATIITVTTVGYGDLTPMTVGGRIFAIGFTIVSIGIVGYALTTLAAVVIERQQSRLRRLTLERRMKQLAQLQNHIIICGGGYIAKRVANEFYRSKIPFIIIEPDEETLRWTLLYLDESYRQKRFQLFKDITANVDTREHEQRDIEELSHSLKVPYLMETPTQNNTLLNAGIGRAKGIITVLNDDRDNILVILSARELARELGNENLRIVTHVADEENVTKLKMAGAERTFLPNVVEGMQLATSMIHPHLGEFWRQILLKEENLHFGDLHVSEHPDLMGQTVNDIRHTQSHLVVSIKRDGQLHNLPDPDFVVESEDILIVLTQKDIL